jgi:hypothetical protein
MYSINLSFVNKIWSEIQKLFFPHATFFLCKSLDHSSITAVNSFAEPHYFNAAPTLLVKNPKIQHFNAAPAREMVRLLAALAPQL